MGWGGGGGGGGVDATLLFVCFSLLMSMPGLKHSTQEVCGGRKRGSEKHCLLYII